MGLILLNIFIAILEGYFRQIAPKVQEEEIGFLSLLQYLITSEFEEIEKKKEQKKKEALQKAEEEGQAENDENNRPEQHQQPRSKISKLKKCAFFIESKIQDLWFAIVIFIYNKIIKRILFQNQAVPSQNQAQPPQINARVEFEERRDSEDENMMLKDIEMYLGKHASNKTELNSPEMALLSTETYMRHY